jgi:2-phosphosulfolactate phosphatase
MAETLYINGAKDLYGFMKEKNASHYQRLTGFGLEKDIRYCLTADVANILSIYQEGKLISR